MQLVDLNKEKESKAKEIQLSDVLALAWRNWYWFVISIVICCGLGFAYLKSQPYVFSRTATVLIKEGIKNGRATESAAFDEMNVLSTTGNIANEQVVFKSKRLMLNVVRILRLDMSYTMKHKLRTLDLYRQSPILVSIADETETQVMRQMFALSVTPQSETEVLLSTTVEDTDWTQRVILNDTIDSPFGKLIVSPTLTYGSYYFNKRIDVAKRSVSQLATSLSNRLVVSVPNIKNTTIVQLSLNDVSALRAEDILNMLIEQYNEDANNDKNLIAINTSNFIDERLDIIEAELGSVDSDIEAFKRHNRLTDISSETGIYLQSSSQFQQQSFALENQLAIAQSIREYLNDTSKGSELIPANTGISDAGIERQISEYNELLLQRNKLDASDRNPVVVNLNNNLLALKQTIVAAVDNLINGLELRIRNTREQEQQTSRRISQVPTQQKYVLSVERQQKIKESLYLYLLNKREETALSQSIKENKAKIIDSAYGTNIPVSPRTSRIMVIAFFLGFIIPVFILWLVFTFDTKIRSIMDIEVAGLPSVGKIPYKKPIIGDFSVTKNGEDPFSNAFNELKANLYLLQKNQGCQVLMVTSFDKEAGKTFVSKNLAASLALSGKKVLLVDLDFNKNNKTSKDKSKQIGLTDYFAGSVSLNEIIARKNIIDELSIDYISTGSYDPNAIELLFDSRIDILIDEQKKHYDYIIFDNVISTLASVSAMNRLVDITIYVLRYGQFDLRAMYKVQKIYEQKELKNMTLALNGMKSERYRLL